MTATPAGWGRYTQRTRNEGRITQSTKVVGEQNFTEEVLAVDSVSEYFQHFPVLEIKLGAISRRACSFMEVA